MDESSTLKRTIARIVLLGKKDEPPAAQARDTKILKVLALIGIPLAIAFHGGVGSLLATVATQDYLAQSTDADLLRYGRTVLGRSSTYWPHCFLLASQRHSVEGSRPYLGKVMMIMGMIYALMEWAEFSIPLWYGYGDVRETSSLHDILFGQTWYVFCIFQVLLVTMIPIALYWFGRKSPKVIGIASLMTAICFLAVRLGHRHSSLRRSADSGTCLPRLGT